MDDGRALVCGGKREGRGIVGYSLTTHFVAARRRLVIQNEAARQAHRDAAKKPSGWSVKA